MNKKGIAPIALVIAVALGILFLMFFASGGLKTMYEITKFMASVPAVVWVVVGFLFLFKMVSK